MHPSVGLFDDVGQARVAAIESRAQRARRLRVAQLCHEAAVLLEALSHELDPDAPEDPLLNHPPAIALLG